MVQQGGAGSLSFQKITAPAPKNEVVGRMIRFISLGELSYNLTLKITTMLVKSGFRSLESLHTLLESVY